MCLCVSQRRGGCKNSLVMSFVHIIHRHITAIWRRWFGVRLAWFRTWTKWPAAQLSMTNGQIFEYSFKYFSYSAAPSPLFCLFFIFEKLDHFSRLFNREANFRKWIQFIEQQRPQLTYCSPSSIMVSVNLRCSTIYTNQVWKRTSLS